MRILKNMEVEIVNGGDAAATRQTGQNSYGEWPNRGQMEQRLGSCKGDLECMEREYQYWVNGL